MERSWITNTKPGDPEYMAGVKEFINFALRNSNTNDRMPCPCYMCHNLIHKRVDEILNHLNKWAFDRTYTYWTFHGEGKDKTFTGTGMDGTRNDPVSDECDRLEDMLQAVGKNFNSNPSTFETLLNDSEKPLYDGCAKYTKLSGVLKLYNLKAGHGWTDVSFSALLEVVKDMLPEDNVLPSGTYEAKKILSTMGLGYDKIHACPNDCILYRNEFESLESCHVCHASRYKKKAGIPAKVLWYFPIIPRFRRLFSNPTDAEKLTWHHNGRTRDNLLRHPADSPQWRFIDEKFSEFGKEERNLRLALSTDGMNPFSSLSSTYSTWPVILVTYNLSPSLCMKRKYMMLSLLISGPKQPGNDIDVYLQPLIDDLKFLWEKGVDVFDAHRKEMFNLKAMLFCTIQDYPAYGNLSGYTVKGKTACPLCEDGFKGTWLKASKKNIFIGHRRFLPSEHTYRKRKKAFDGKQMFESRPKVPSSGEVFEKIKDIHITFGKKNRKDLQKQGYKKCSVLWQLPYWKHLFVRHSLDIMHIEKNVCDSLIGTLLNIKGKTKDGVNARADLQQMEIRTELHPIEKGPKKRKFLPPAAYTLSRKEKVEFCECLAGMKVPEGYSSNISSLVSMENLKLVGLKSHDCHVLMQQLLPVAIRGILPKNVRVAIIRLCSFFNVLYSKVIDPKDLDDVEREIVLILCQLEMYFPPSFFDIMIHLTVHLVREVRYCGPVYLRNEYPFERQMKSYKGYVKNYRRPEGCIAERVQYEEVLAFCGEFLENVKIIGLPIPRHNERMNGKGTIGHRQVDLPRDEWIMAHTYILNNEEEVLPYIIKHKSYLRKVNPKENERSLANEHKNTFSTWLKEQVRKELQDSSQCISDRLRSLAYGPNFNASLYSAYVINGCTFYTRDQDENSTMQNSGITLEVEAVHFASAKDNNPVYCKMQYYGFIEEIYELHYHDFAIPLFRCKWVDNQTGVAIDELGFTVVNFMKQGYKEDPFILASQAKQVFYVSDPADKRKSIVITPRSRHEIDDFEDDVMLDEAPATTQMHVEDDENGDSSTYVRNDHDEGIYVEENNIEGYSRKRHRKE